MTNLLIRFAINAVSIYITSLVVPGIHIEGWEAILGAALLFGVVNAVIKPIVSMVTCLVQIITLGLFTLVINALMLLLTAWVARQLGLGFTVDGFWSAFFGAILISLVSTALSFFPR